MTPLLLPQIKAIRHLRALILVEEISLYYGKKLPIW